MLFWLNELGLWLMSVDISGMINHGLFIGIARRVLPPRSVIVEDAIGMQMYTAVRRITAEPFPGYQITLWSLHENEINVSILYGNGLYRRPISSCSFNIVSPGSIKNCRDFIIDHFGGDFWMVKD